jgi:1,4-dihydroxy-2-naphthoyl-CoA hydrolase
MRTMAIWFESVTAQELHERQRGTLADHVGIRIVEIGDDYLRGTMPVDHRTIQPMGVLHGGASVVLAETLGSVAGMLVLDRTKFVCLGQEINANHLRPATAGLVIGTARPYHIGARSHVWGIEIRDERGKLTCVSRLTLAVVERPERLVSGGASK